MKVNASDQIVRISESSNPKVSVVLPTYNQANYLSRALDSFLDQDFQDFELIVVNDGSTDETSTILAKYQQRFNFICINQDNLGLPAALNNGFSRTRGEYLTWTSSDNIMLPLMLHDLSAELDANPEIGVVYSDWYVIDDEDTILSRAESIEYDPYILYLANYINASFLYRRKCREQIGDYDVNMTFNEDWDYWLRISQYYSMKRLPTPLYLYRTHSESLTLKNPSEERYLAFIKIWKKRTPFRWWYGKIKWNFLKRRYGRFPTVQYIPMDGNNESGSGRMWKNWK